MRINQEKDFTIKKKIETYKKKYLNNMKKIVAKHFYFEGNNLMIIYVKVKHMEAFNENMEPLNEDIGMEIGD